MNAEEISAIAKQAVNRSMSRISIWWPEDREDAQQEAALAILLAARRGLDKDRGYYFGAACKGVYLWIRLWLRPNRHTFPLLANVEELLAAPTTLGDAMLRHLESLAPLLRGLRVKCSARAESDIALEVEYCRLMIEGYRMEEAARILGRTRRNTLALRARVLPRLRMIANNEKPEAHFAKPGPASLAALRRTEADPEALRRRNAAISAAKRKATA